MICFQQYPLLSFHISFVLLKCIRKVNAHVALLLTSIMAYSGADVTANKYRIIAMDGSVYVAVTPNWPFDILVVDLSFTVYSHFILCWLPRNIRSRFVSTDRQTYRPT